MPAESLTQQYDLKDTKDNRFNGNRPVNMFSQPLGAPPPKDKIYATQIYEYLDKGKPVTVCIWDESQRTAAETYIKSALKKHANGDVKIEVARSDVRTGDVRQGRHLIRYHFSSSVIPLPPR